MIQKPKVSIGLPVYNGERFLRAAVDSLLGQTFGDLELIISDNGSTDATAEICASYSARDARIRFTRQDCNRGGIWNHNHVFRLARGEYFRWAGHDDVCAPTFLARCVETLDRDPSVVWCHTETKIIDSSGDVVALDEVRTCRGWDDIVENGTRRPHRLFRAAVLYDASWTATCYGLLRSDAVARTGLFRPYYGSDKLFIAQLSLLGQFKQVPEPLFFRRFHSAASGNAPSAAYRHAWCTGGPKPWFVFPRARLLSDYLRLAVSAPIPLGERIHCMGAVGRYFLQAEKWIRLLRRTCGLKGTGAYAELVRALERHEATNKRKPNTVAHTLGGWPPDTGLSRRVLEPPNER
jgi:glycosyltransferase involved in cell wall biosynthesis